MLPEIVETKRCHDKAAVGSESRGRRPPEEATPARMIRQSVSGLAIRSMRLLKFWSATGRKTGFHFCWSRSRHSSPPKRLFGLVHDVAP
jgi:hypothetical protein